MRPDVASGLSRNDKIPRLSSNILLYIISHERILGMNAQIIDQFLQKNPFAAILLTIWVLTWKGFALWTASKKDQKPWFVAILVINTLGLLEIIYLFVVPKIKFTFHKPSTPEETKKKSK